MKAYIITVGNEILTGRTVDTNSSYIGKRFLEWGIDVIRKVVVSDNEEDIAVAIKEALRKANIVISTGGLGPTPDDRLRFALAKVFGKPLEENIEAKCMLLNYLTKTKTESAKLQAMMPQGSIPIKNLIGVAPGIFYRTEKNKIIIALPGVPQEMKWMLDNEVKSLLQSELNFRPLPVKILRTTGIFEIRILERLENELGEKVSSIAFYPSYDGVDLRFVGEGNDEIYEVCKRAIEGFVYAEEEKDLSEVVGELLRKTKSTLATAESCTGGMLASRIVDISGSSDYFLGSVVGYANETKTKLLRVKEESLKRFGAVSAQVASEMATGVRDIIGSTYALSTTGIAGPTGGTRTKPIGLVYIGLAHPDGVYVREYNFKGTREAVRRRTTQAALFILYLKLTGKLENFKFEDTSKEVGL